MSPRDQERKTNPNVRGKKQRKKQTTPKTTITESSTEVEVRQKKYCRYEHLYFQLFVEKDK